MQKMLNVSFTFVHMTYIDMGSNYITTFYFM